MLFLTDGKNPGSGIIVWEFVSIIFPGAEEQFFGLKYFKQFFVSFCVADLDPGSRINIPDPKHCPLMSDFVFFAFKHISGKNQDPGSEFRDPG